MFGTGLKRDECNTGSEVAKYKAGSLGVTVDIELGSWGDIATS